MTFRNLLRVLMAVVAATLLSACAVRTFTPPVPATAASLPDKAVVIVSVSHDVQAGTEANGRITLDGRTPQYMLFRTSASLLESAIRNDFTDRIGQVYVIEVAPGHHRFTSWSVQMGGRVAQTSADDPPLEFDVAAGQVVYLGDLHIDLTMHQTRLTHNNFPVAAVVRVADRSAVDIAIAEAANPWIAGKARTKLLTPDVWGAGLPPAR